MKFLKQLPSILLGLIFVVFGIQFFFFVNSGMEMPVLGGFGDQYNMIMMQTGYMWVVKVLEVLIGLMILVPRTRALGLVLIAPIIVNIFLFEILIIGKPGAGIVPVAVALVLEVIALWQHRDRYLPMVRKA